MILLVQIKKGAGTYKVGSKEIELTRDGAVLNCEYASYESKNDFVMSSGYNMMTFNGAIEVVYIIDGDDVILFEPVCETMEGDECFGYKPGKALHRLVNIK